MIKSNIATYFVLNYCSVYCGNDIEFEYAVKDTRRFPKLNLVNKTYLGEKLIFFQ